MPPRLEQRSRGAWPGNHLAAKSVLRIDERHWAGSFIAAACATLLRGRGGTVRRLPQALKTNGVFGGTVAWLLWNSQIGRGSIFGACLCAARARGRLAPPTTASMIARGEIKP